MLTWDTVSRLVRSDRVNPLLVGLVLEEIESAIRLIQEKRSQESLSSLEDELLRALTLKRYLLMKRLRSHLHSES